MCGEWLSNLAVSKQNSVLFEMEFDLLLTFILSLIHPIFPLVADISSVRHQRILSTLCNIGVRGQIHLLVVGLALLQARRASL